MHKDEAIRMISQYERFCLFRPYNSWAKYDFMVRSYTRWATEEIIRLIDRSEEDDPHRIVSGFMLQMDEFYERSEQGKTQTLFSIARDSARDILELIDKFDMMKGGKRNERVLSDPFYPESHESHPAEYAVDSDFYGYREFRSDNPDGGRCYSRGA